MLKVIDTVCDTLEDRPVHLFSLHNPTMHLTLTNLGASLRTLWVPDRSGRLDNVVAGYKDVLAYADNPLYLGCTIGRYANRIGRGHLLLNGVTYQLTLNEGTNHLHGGFRGFNRKLWTLKEIVRSADEVGVVMCYRSVDGEEGYPGNLDVTVRYTLGSDNRLRLDYTAHTDKPTPVNLTNHSYFNLSAFAKPSIDDHILQVAARGYMEKNGSNLPTGVIGQVEGTSLDFTKPGRIGARLRDFPADRGIDHNFVLDRGVNAVPLAAQLHAPSTGRRLRLYTDKPCLQVYTANWWDGSIVGTQGVSYQPHGAVALETQFAPDSPNQPGFPDTILQPGKAYRTTTIFEFDVHDQV